MSKAKCDRLMDYFGTEEGERELACNMGNLFWLLHVMGFFLDPIEVRPGKGNQRFIVKFRAWESDSTCVIYERTLPYSKFPQVA